MTQLCETCLVTVAFGWSEVACGECARLAVRAVGTSLDAECVQLMAFGWEDAACARCRGESYDGRGLAIAA